MDETSNRVAQYLRSKLTLYNTLGESHQSFVPQDEREVLIYICGPTVYTDPHIGNMRTYVFADVLLRVLRLAGYGIRAAMNITDVGHLTSNVDEGEDKLQHAADAAGTTAWVIAEKYRKQFFDDVRQLNIMPVGHVLKATEHIGEQIELVRKLEDKGVTYRTSDGIYFDTSKIEDYGKLTPRDDRTQLLAGSRVDMREKRHPTDFALWKFSPAEGPRRDMEWPSPWGVGFPGWHIECSAMALAHLGDTLDIHVGGIDHIGTHHTNEIAQSETATGEPFSRWWMHGAFLELAGAQRMGKSEGNVVTLNTLSDRGYHPLEFRYLVLLSHYRNPLTFSQKALDSAARAYRRLRKRIAEFKAEAESVEKLEPVGAPHLDEFLAALADDLNTPRAVAALWAVVRTPDLDVTQRLRLIETFDLVLGLNLMEKQVTAGVPAAILELAERRWQLKLDRRYKEADQIRAQVARAGYSILDRSDGFEVEPTRG